MELLEAEQLAMRLMEEHEVFDRGWSFEWSNAKRQLGSVQLRGGRDAVGRPITRKLIKLSRHLVRLNDVEQVRDTILHEIAHVLAGLDHGHDEKWRQTCLRIGAKPSRTADERIKLVECRFLLICGCCERVLARRHRRMGRNRLSRSWCKFCGRESKGTLWYQDSADEPEEVKQGGVQ